MSDPMIIRARLAAPIDAVRRALTEPAQLRAWFAEHAEVELPNRFAFWGRYTPEGDAPHQRLLHVDDTTLRFNWLLDGVDTTTELSLAATAPDATLLTLTQSHFDYQEMMSGTSIRGVLQTFWVLATANLADHLEGRPLTARVDFTSAELRADVLVDASAATIFDALTDSQKVTSWFGFPIEIEAEVGGRYTMGGFDNPLLPAKVIELEPGRKLAVDWGSRSASRHGSWPSPTARRG